MTCAPGNPIAWAAEQLGVPVDEVQSVTFEAEPRRAVVRFFRSERTRTIDQ